MTSEQIIFWVAYLALLFLNLSIIVAQILINSLSDSRWTIPLPTTLILLLTIGSFIPVVNFAVFIISALFLFMTISEVVDLDAKLRTFVRKLFGKNP